MLKENYENLLKRYYINLYLYFVAWGSCNTLPFYALWTSA